MYLYLRIDYLDHLELHEIVLIQDCLYIDLRSFTNIALVSIDNTRKTRTSS